MTNIFIFLAVLLASASAGSFSSDEDCDDSGHNSHEHGHGRRAKAECEVGWKQFNRPSGRWCMKVLQGHITQPQAEANCKLQGATLSSLQNEQEILWITSTAVNLFPQRSGMLWVGAKRTAACIATHLTPTCNGNTAFEWTDGSATGTAGFLWNRKQPDNDKKVQYCAALLAMVIPQTRDYWPWLKDRLDDRGCAELGFRERTMRGYVCGKRPSRRR
uniref:C-type lectin domain-containing protein n=1 Tax=Caenorhabditis tropicalis TaxID=1561998 RepID=A0A1I7T9Z0_9PELO